MKDLLKQAFQAGRDFGHAMGTGRPTYGLTFDEWYSENENQALSIANVVGRSEQLPPKCLDGFDDDKFCDRSGECKWCKDIRR